jgi:allantoin racemase
MRLPLIAIVHPVRGGFPPAHAAEWRALAPASIELDLIPVDGGPDHVLTRKQETEAEPFVLTKLHGADQRGMPVAIVACFTDPALSSPTVATMSMIVIGMGYAAMKTASDEAGSFSIVTIVPPAYMTDVARREGFGDRLVSVRRVAVLPEQLRSERARVLELTIRESVAAVRADGARAICLGCSGMSDMRMEVEEACGVPVFDAKGSAMRMASHVADAGNL